MVQVERIAQMESLFEQINQVLNQLDLSLEQYQSITLMIDKLADYYSSNDWKQDFFADEMGELPKDLKRGVLSEDGIYNLLVLHSELLNKMKMIIKTRESNE